MKRITLLYIVLCASFVLSFGQYAVVSLSVGSVYSKARYTSGVTTQTLMGTPLKVLGKESYWYHIQTPEGYKGWITKASIELLSPEELSNWKSSPRIIITSYHSIIYKDYLKSEIISDAAMGNIIQYLEAESNEDYYRVILPNEMKGWVKKDDAEVFSKWANSRTPDTESIIKTAKQLLGFPYLWGGTSVYGMDCSGFTKTVFFLNGIVLPRDAWQQAAVGDEIDISNGVENLQMGDFLFFGTKAGGNKKEKITHVGLYTEDGEFIHSASKVQINSLLPGKPNYYRARPVIRARRIAGNQDKSKDIISLSNHQMYFN